MKLMHSEWQDRVKHWIRTLQDDLYEPLGEISWEAFQTMDYLTLEEALKGSFAPVAPGFTWGREWEYCWFKGQGRADRPGFKARRGVGDFCERKELWNLPGVLGGRAPSLYGGQCAQLLRPGRGAL